jgi:hypothetical protein
MALKTISIMHGETEREKLKEELKKEIEAEQKKKKSKDSEPYYQSWIDKFNHAMDAQKFKGSSKKGSKATDVGKAFDYLG